jgi:glucans biosynthesis protein C
LGVGNIIKQRLFYLDNLKVFLTLLVIVHHVGQPYGGSNGFWYYVSHDHLNLGRFFSVNAGFFMSLFFLISAYFLPASFERKGSKAFLKDRFKRLGIPLLFGFFIIIPILMYFYYINYRSYGYKTFLDYYVNVYFGLGGVPKGWTGPSFPDMQFGHLWFIEHLLVYAVLYVLFTKLLRHTSLFSFIKGELTNIKLLIMAILVSLLTFFVRIYYPIDHWEGLLGIIQVEYAHLPQYASFFILGILSFKHKWLDKLNAKTGITWLIIGVGIASLRYYTDFLPYSQGGLNNDNLYYSVIETFLCFGLGFGLLYLFKKSFNKTNSFWKLMADNSFAAYIFHLPIAVLIQYLLNTTALKPSIKFPSVSIVTILITYLFCFMIRKIRWIRSII